MEVRVLSGNFEGLIPHKRMTAEMRNPVVLDKSALAFLIDKSEGMDTETLHHTKGSRNSPVGSKPLLHVSSLLMERYEVPSIVVRSLGLRYLIVGSRLNGVDDIWEFDSILKNHQHYSVWFIQDTYLDKEDWHVVAHCQS